MIMSIVYSKTFSLDHYQKFLEIGGKLGTDHYLSEKTLQINRIFPLSQVCDICYYKEQVLCPPWVNFTCERGRCNEEIFRNGKTVFLPT